MKIQKGKIIAWCNLLQTVKELLMRRFPWDMSIDRETPLVSKELKKQRRDGGMLVTSLQSSG